MATSRKFGKDLLVDYAWSAWAALGVSSWQSTSFAASIDIESLVLLTGALGDADPRLRDESIDWCVSNVSLISRSRLAHIVRDGSPNEKWATYAATLQDATKQNWPGAGKSAAWTASRKSRLPERAEGSTLALRCRGLLGTTARSEIVRVLVLDESERPWEVRELVGEVRYTKRGVAEALDGLFLAGVVRPTTVGNARRFALVRATELKAVLAPLPRVRSSQRALIRILLAATLATDQLVGASSRVRLVEEARIVRDAEPELRRVDPKIELPNAQSGQLQFLQAWCAEQVAAALEE